MANHKLKIEHETKFHAEGNLGHEGPRREFAIRFFLPVVFSFLFFLSCNQEKPALFPAKGTNAVLYAQGRDAQNGALDFSRPKKLIYRFDPSLPALPLSSFEIEYSFSYAPTREIKDEFSLVLETETDSWALPMDLSFLYIALDNDAVIHYAIPMEDSFSGRFNITLQPADRSTKKDAGPVFKILSVRFRERWFGFWPGAEKEAGHFFITPFTFRQDEAYVIDLPAVFGGRLKQVQRPNQPQPEVTAFLSTGQRAGIEHNGRRYDALSGMEKINLPSVLFLDGPVILSGDRIDSFQITYSTSPPFPVPIDADPALVLEWPQENWRHSGWEIFRWDRFPSLLIIDTENYAVQDRLLKRLAFFVEKAGFRGRLAPDEEIAALHGWNAHDYRAEDLARFFDIALKTGFPLLDEERLLEKVLLDEGIIIRDGDNIAAGDGGIISVSRESAGYLRRMFMVHEGFHGLFFIDEDFRDFSRRRLERLSPAAKRFILSYFGFQQYDINDEYLLVNEYMGHILQQAVSQAAVYFGKTLPSRLENTWRSSSLPAKNEALGSWPELASAFTSEAEAFSAYVNRRWGLAAGRVWTLTIRNQ